MPSSRSSHDSDRVAGERRRRRGRPRRRRGSSTRRSPRARASRPPSPAPSARSRRSASARRRRGRAAGSRPPAGTRRQTGGRGDASRERSFEDLQPARQVVVGDRQRRQQPDDVAVQAAAEQQQALLAGRGDRGRRRRSGAGVLDSRSRTISSASIGPSPRTSPIASTRVAMSSSAARSRAPERLALRAASPGTASSTTLAAAQETGLPPNVPPSPPGSTASMISAGPVTPASGRPPPSDLPRDEQVGLRVVVLDRPHRPGAADAGLDLVVDPQDPVAVAQLAQLGREVGRHRDEAALALDGLEDHGGDASPDRRARGTAAPARRSSRRSRCPRYGYGAGAR